MDKNGGTVKSIWKWPLEVTSVQELKMPAGAKILCVQVQDELPVLWALIDPNEPKIVQCRINVIGTGHRIEGDPGRYISTFQMAGGQLVFHAFEVVA